MASQILLPGDTIRSDLLPTSQKRKIHPSIRQFPSFSSTTTSNINNNNNHDNYTATQAGPLQTDIRKKTARILSPPRSRYTPQPGDAIIGQIRISAQEVYHVHITPHGQQAMLGHLSFEGATKKSRPNLKPGDLVYARITATAKGMDVEISCVNPSTGKADGFGPLTGGFVVDVSLGFAERLLVKSSTSTSTSTSTDVDTNGGVRALTEELTAKIPGGFEIAVGKNGRVWISCSPPKKGLSSTTTEDTGVGRVAVMGCVLVARCFALADEASLTEAEQRKLVRRVAADMGLG